MHRFISFIRRLFPNSPKSWARTILLFALFTTLTLFTELRLDETLLGVFAAWIFFADKDARISIGFALAGLLAIPLLTLLENRDITIGTGDAAETIAVWVYFFLIIGVGKQLFDFVRDTKEEGAHTRESSNSSPHEA
ncbi:MAG: hypothetical protein IPL87_02870 [Candidatus Moraniibacteriota bacterium]|nr:MAG: hypothetical protein IPL87_02870 [Candidatus Moranbacteria bacterium]